MPRALGQIDAKKHRAILDAAAEVLAERGIAASIEEVARRAGVSKQTIYNHYSCKTELIRTLIDRRRSLLTATFQKAPPGEPVEETLARYAMAMMDAILAPTGLQLARMAIAAAQDMPELARAVHEAGAMAANEDLAAFLASRPELEIPDARRAADIFIGMAFGRMQTRLLMGVGSFEPDQARDRAVEAAQRFVRAYRKPERDEGSAPAAG